jgi:hypothetical protein
MINDSDLVIPHRSALERPFVIIPMAEIAPNFSPACAAGKNMAEIASSIMRNASCLPAKIYRPSAVAGAARQVFDPAWAGSGLTRAV